MKHLYIDPTSAHIGGATWRDVCQKVGATVTYAPTRHVLAVDDPSALRIAKMANVLFPNPTQMHSITDRIAQQSLGVPVLPSVIPMTPEDFHTFGAVPLFIKHRRTYNKTYEGVPYSSWASPEAAIAGLGDAFFAEQRSPSASLGEFVLQPSVGFPHDILAVSVSINEHGEPFLFQTTRYSYEERETYGIGIADSEDTPPPEVANAIHKVCTDVGLVGGMYYIEFVQYAGAWVLMDWNCRPDVGTSRGRMTGTNVPEAALAHMLGLPSIAIEPYYTVQYRADLLQWAGVKEMNVAVRMGMHARMQVDRLWQVAVSKPSRAEAMATIDAFLKEVR